MRRQRSIEQGCHGERVVTTTIQTALNLVSSLYGNSLFKKQTAKQISQNTLSHVQVLNSQSASPHASMQNV